MRDTPLPYQPIWLKDRCKLKNNNNDNAAQNVRGKLYDQSYISKIPFASFHGKK